MPIPRRACHAVVSAVLIVLLSAVSACTIIPPPVAIQPSWLRLRGIRDVGVGASLEDSASFHLLPEGCEFYAIQSALGAAGVPMLYLPSSGAYLQLVVSVPPPAPDSVTYQLALQLSDTDPRDGAERLRWQRKARGRIAVGSTQPLRDVERLASLFAADYRRANPDGARWIVRPELPRGCPFG